MTTVTSRPWLRPSSSADWRVITDTIWWPPPMSTATSAITPPSLTAVTRPGNWLRALSCMAVLLPWDDRFPTIRCLTIPRLQFPSRSRLSPLAHLFPLRMTKPRLHAGLPLGGVGAEAEGRVDQAAARTVGDGHRLADERIVLHDLEHRL